MHTRDGYSNIDRPTMSIDLAQIELASLSPAQRLLLAQALLDSVMFDTDCGGGELSPSQLSDLGSRADEVRSERVACEPWETVYTRLSKAQVGTHAEASP